MGHQQGLTMMGPSALAGAGGAPSQTMRYWRVSPTVTACVVSRRLIFLDIASDRYLALPDALTDDFVTWLHSPGTPPPRSCHAMLASLGMTFEDIEHLVPMECCLAKPQPIDTPTLPAQRVSLAQLFSVGRATYSAWVDVRAGQLRDVLARRIPGPARGSEPTSGLFARLATFRSARPLVPVRRTCLHDCLALFDWLGPDARGVSLVFGVSAYPFAAHSWLQAGDIVIDDHPESPSRYQPILHLP